MTAERLRQLQAPLPFDQLDAAAQHQLAEQANDEAWRTRDAVLLWLRHAGTTTESRRELATSILLGSVFAQAALLGCVACGRCGDRGCSLCPGRLA